MTGANSTMHFAGRDAFTSVAWSICVFIEDKYVDVRMELTDLKLRSR
jgi:hypothetical protein